MGPYVLPPRLVYKRAQQQQLEQLEKKYTLKPINITEKRMQRIIALLKKSMEQTKPRSPAAPGAKVTMETNNEDR